MKFTFLGDLYLPELITNQSNIDSTVILNLEYPVTDYEKGYPGKVNLKAEANYLRDVFGDRTIIANLANNHIMDYREHGFNDTLESLKKENIYYFGAGRQKDNFNNPLFIEFDNTTVAFLGYADDSSSPVFGGSEYAGAVPLNLETIFADIKKARQKGADYIIISLHWGAQDVHCPTPDAQKKAHAIIENGADLIIGHHSHCLQPIEWYKKKLICYGLGNAVFPDLNVPSYYNKDGTDFKYTRTKQEKWNRESLVVNWRPEEKKISYKKSYFDGTRFTVSTDDFKPKQIASKISTLQFRTHYFYGKLRKTLYHYFRNPKLPKPVHIKALFNMIIPKNYK